MEYISICCIAGADKVGSQLPTRVIDNLCLKIIVLVLTRILELATSHQVSMLLMLYDVECLIPMVYDFCTSLLANMNSQTD
jgi:hypothetical protein